MNILVADDENLIRSALTRAFQSRKNIVFAAENGIVALEILNKEKIDLVVLDLLMPEKNGFDVLAEMPKTLPVIIISAFSGHNQEHFHSNEFPHVIGFFKKPFEHLNHILDQIEKQYENYIRKI